MTVSGAMQEDGDQRPSKTDVGQHVEGFSGGQQNAHNPLDSKDQQSYANKLSAASELEREEKQATGRKDPLAPALSHDNEPSKGAKIDAELQAEEEELLSKK